MLYDKAMITNASREAARTGIVFSYPSRISKTDIDDVVSKYCGENLVTFGNVDPENPPLKVGITECGETGDNLTVTVTYSYGFLVLPNFVTALTGPLELSAVTAMRCE